jgi:hypothetical protein
MNKIVYRVNENSVITFNQPKEKLKIDAVIKKNSKKVINNEKYIKFKV